VAIAYKGSGGAAATSVTIPTHAVGDLILIFTVRAAASGYASVPSAGGTVPTWTSIDTGTYGPDYFSSYANLRVASTIATATNHTSGTWTNADYMVAVVFSGTAVSPKGGSAFNGGTSGDYGATTLTAPAVTLQNAGGSSAIVKFTWNPVSSWSTPSGYTSRYADAATVFAQVITKNTTTSDATATTSTTGSGFSWVSYALELKEPATAAFFAMF
jgi:hypothetical protein